MTTILMIIVIALVIAAAVAVILEFAQYRRNVTIDIPQIKQSFESVEKSFHSV